MTKWYYTQSIKQQMETATAVLKMECALVASDKKQEFDSQASSRNVCVKDVKGIPAQIRWLGKFQIQINTVYSPVFSLLPAHSERPQHAATED